MKDITGEAIAESRIDPKPSMKVQVLELGVFLLLVVPPMVLSSFLLEFVSLSFPAIAWSSMLQATALLCLVLFFVWRNGETLQTIGLSFRNAGRELVLGTALFLPFFLGIILIENILRAGGFSVQETPPTYLMPSGLSQFVLAFGFLVVIAVSEEVIFRGYLILRCGAVTGSLRAAVILSAVIFSVGHGYQGLAGVVTVGAMGLVFAMIYLWRGSLVAPIAMHFLQNFVGVILVPLSKGG